jgi:hypothetical protein
MQGEIGRRSGGDNVLEREGYAVAAGSALGFVALGDLHFMTMIRVAYLELVPL